MRTVLDTGPAIEPITVDEAAEFSRVCDDEDRSSLLSLITSARQYAERVTQRQMITATWIVYLDSFAPRIYLPYPPLQTVDTVKYLDTAGVERTLTVTTDYQTISTSEPAWIQPAYGESWPSTYGVPDAVWIEYTAGYGDDRSDVPEMLRLAMKQLVVHWFDRRSPYAPGALAETPKTLDLLLQSYWHGHTWY